MLVEPDRTGRIVNSYFIIFHHVSCASNADSEQGRDIQLLEAAAIVYFHQFSGESGKKWILPPANFSTKKRLTFLKIRTRVDNLYMVLYCINSRNAVLLHVCIICDICKILVCC